MPPRRTCPNSSSFSLTLLSPAPSFAPSATTTMEKFTPRERCRRMMCSQTRSMSMGFSGMRITSAPPAMPECVAIQPACRPITSQTITRLCDSAVECSRSMASVAICTAVLKPKVRSVPERSLSMVLGIPTTFTPIWWSLVATPRVSSPPMATTAPTFSAERFRTTISAPPGFLNGFVRLVPRIVPPRGRMPLVASRVSRKWSGGSIRPRQPSRTPITSRPCCSPRRTTARITALRPGQSPPPVRTAIFMAANLAGGRRDFKHSGVKVAPGDHLHRPEEKVLLGVRLPAARLPRRPVQPLPRHHVAVMRERRKKLGVGLGQVPPYERPQQRSELPAGQEGMPAARVQPSVEFVRDVEQLVHQRLHPLLGRTGAEELRPQSDAVERALALERHARAGERLDRRTRSAPGFSGHEQDARRLDVRQLRQLPCHVRREAPAEQRRVGPCRSSGGHEWEPVRGRTLSWRW